MNSLAGAYTAESLPDQIAPCLSQGSLIILRILWIGRENGPHLPLRENWHPRGCWALRALLPALPFPWLLIYSSFSAFSRFSPVFRVQY